MNDALPEHHSALSAIDWRDWPDRTSGNDGVPLQYPGWWKAGREPERPAPSLLHMSSHFPVGRN